MLIDSSAWIEYLRHTGSKHDLAVQRAISYNEVHSVDPVRLELLCGAASEAFAGELIRLLDLGAELDLQPRLDAEAAGAIYRLCHRQGETVRRPNDCLVAAVAIRHDVPVLHRDADYDVIARHAPLQVVSV